MEKIQYPSSINLSEFSIENKNPLVKYGLPADVVYCKKCVMSNQRPNSAVEYSHTKNSAKATIHFDSEGVCDACRFAERKNTMINWGDREKELLELCNRYRKDDGSYDCIVPGSGGKDSFYTSHVLKNKYGMHPLTVTWSPHIYTEWGWKNFQAWIHAGHDNYLMTPNGRVHRVLTRLSTELLLHPFQAFMFGQKVLPTKIAMSLNIPLVFYGENEVEYGNPIGNSSSARRDESFFTAANQNEIYLAGLSVSDLKDYFDINLNDLQPYMPADPEQVHKKQIEVHYLGHYLKWHPQSCYYYAVEHGGFQASPERTPGTYSKYSSIDDRIDDLHFYTTGVKFGIGHATYDAAQEIRSGDINREEGIALIKRFDHEYPNRFADELFQYLSLPERDFPEVSHMFESPIMDQEYFRRLTDKFRSPHIWYNKCEQWLLRNPIWNE